MAWTADAIEEHQSDHREHEHDQGLEDDFELVNQKRLAVLADKPGARLFSEYGEDDDDESGNNCEQQQEERAQMHAPVATAERIAFDDAETFDEADHHLRAGEQRAAEAEQKPFPGMLALAHEILRDDVFAAGRKNQLEAIGDLAQSAVEGGGAADDAQREKQHGKKARNMLKAMAWLRVMQSGKMRPRPRKRFLSIRSIEVVGGIIRLVTANRANFLRRCDCGTRRISAHIGHWERWCGHGGRLPLLAVQSKLCRRLARFARRAGGI